MNKSNRWLIIFGVAGLLDVFSRPLIGSADEGLASILIALPFGILFGTAVSTPLGAMIGAILAIGWIPAFILAYWKRTKPTPKK